MAHYLLVHGGLHGGWCWERVVPLLEAAGHTVHAPDLPGMGADATPFAEDTFGQWIDAMVGWLDALEEPAIVVGHSQGGPVMSQAAERRPEKIRALVYLTALMRKHGECLIGDIEQGLKGSDLSVGLHVREDGLTMLPPDVAAAAFYNTCSPEDVASALARLTPQPPSVVLYQLSLSAERFGSVPKFYIETRHDQAIPLETQQAMQDNWPCTLLGTLDTDHSPFMCQPEETTRLLLEVA